MKSFKVLAAVINYDTNQYELVKEIVGDDDSVSYNLHTFGVEILEHYAAIYDTDDIDTLIDMVVHEPFVGDVETFKTSAEEARSKFLSKLDDVKKKGSKPSQADKANARERMQARGIEEKYLLALDSDPYQVIRDSAPFDKEVIQLRKEIYHKQRTKPQRPVESRGRDKQARIAEAKKLLQGPTGKMPKPDKVEGRHVTVSLRKGHKPELS